MKSVKNNKKSENNSDQNQDDKKVGQVLCCRMAIRGPVGDRLLFMLDKVRFHANQYLKTGYNEDTLNELRTSSKKAYKVLEPILPQSSTTKRVSPKISTDKIPSRINRCILEIAGRNLRAIANRKFLFDSLVKLEPNPEKWEMSLLPSGAFSGARHYLQNLREQVKNFIAKEKRNPWDFFDLQPCPQVKKPILTYASDDGQAIKIKLDGEHAEIEFKLFIPDEPDTSSLEEESPANQPGKWVWEKLRLKLPPRVQGKKAVNPDLRFCIIHGRRTPILEYKCQEPCEPYVKTDYILTVDWGCRKLVTFCVFDREGNQVSPPFFLKFTPVVKKLDRIRKQIDDLKAKRDKLPKDSLEWAKYNREIAKLWRKYRALNLELAHLASNVLVLVALIYGCCEIYIEDLRSLKSMDKGAKLNWLINSTVRSAIYEKLAYKAFIHGILCKAISPAYTSQYCPRCGALGYHTHASDSKEKQKSGSWFCCPKCGYNADRDYVAVINIARKALYGNFLKNQPKVIVYKKIASSDLLSRQRSCCPRVRLRRCVNGWHRSVFFSPSQKIFAGTLKL